MPGMDGWAVLSALKADPPWPTSGWCSTMVDEKNRGFAMGAADFITKPVDRERLVSVLRRLAGTAPSWWWTTTATPARRLLEGEGYAVVEAEDGRAALDLRGGPRRA